MKALHAVTTSHYPPGNALSCQDYKSSFEIARDFINEGKYREAVPILEKLVKEDPNNYNLSFLLGYCYYHVAGERQKAMPLLEKAVKRVERNYNDLSSGERNAPVYAYYYLGLCYHAAGRLQEALAYLEKFRSYLVNGSGDLINQKNQEVFNELNQHLSRVKSAIDLAASPARFVFLDIPLVNAGNFSVYGGQFSPDYQALYFSRERINKSIRGKPDVFVLKKLDQQWMKIESPGLGVNSPYHDVFNAISSDYQFMLFSSNRNGSYNIFYTTAENNKWSEPVDNLSINSPYNETYAIISKEKNRIVFVSDRPGGFGGKDIYKTDRKPDGSWSEPENIGFTVNTPYDEDTPWLSNDGNTLYFSSEGHGSMGGSDVFYSNFRNHMWSEPVNLGSPVNSVANDLYFKWIAEENLVLFSSNRVSGGNTYTIFAGSFPDSGAVSTRLPASSLLQDGRRNSAGDSKEMPEPYGGKEFRPGYIKR